MKKFRERNLYIVAAVSAVVLVFAAYVALNFSKLPLIGNEHTYHADFATAVGLNNGDVVTIAGVRVGAVTGMNLQGGVADVSFEINGSHHLGDGTRVDVKILNPVGVEYLQVTPAGPGNLQGTIPVSRTTVPDTLVYDLNQLTAQTQQTNLPQLVDSLKVLTQTLAAGTPSETKAALDGVAELSAVLDDRQVQLGQLITQADELTSVLNSRDSQLVGILTDGDEVLQVLNQRRTAIQNLLTTTTTLAAQIDHLIVNDSSEITPLLANLKTVSKTLANDDNSLETAMPLLAAFNRYAANVTGSGPFADVVAPTLVIPDNLIDECASIANIDTERGCRP